MKKQIISMLLTINIIITTFPANAFVKSEEPNILYGDADSNKLVDLQDINLMQRYIAKEQTALDKINLTNADVNADGTIDDEDVRLVKEYLVGNSALTPQLCTIKFDTDGGGDIAPITAGVGYSYKVKIPDPSKQGYIFVKWIKEDGSTFYQDEDVIKGNMTLKAVFEEVESLENLQLNSFSLDHQSKNVSFEITGDFESTDEVKANIKVLPKDGSDPVATDVKENGNGNYEVFAPDGFVPGATYELTLGDGLYFAGKEKTFRTVIFIIDKQQIDNMKYNSDVIFIQDTDQMNYTIGGKTQSVLESSLLSNDEGKEDVTGTFTMPDGNLAVDDIVCIYENVPPQERDYTKNNYEDDALAYIRITAADQGNYEFESLDEDDAGEVLSMPESILFRVDQLPVSDGTVSKNDYDAYARTALGQKEAPEYEINDFLIFYTGSFEDAKNGGEVVYGQVTEITDETLAYKIVAKEDIENFMEMFVSQEVDGQTLMEEIDQGKVLSDIKNQAENSGFIDAATGSMVQSALGTEMIQQKLLDNGAAPAEINQLIQAAADGSTTDDNKNDDGSRTKIEVEDTSVSAEFIKGKRFDNGIGVCLEVGLTLSINTKVSQTEISSLKIELSAGFEQELSFGFDVNADDRWVWYGPVPILKDLDVNVAVDIQNYSSVSVGAKLYTVSGEAEKEKWEALSDKFNGPDADPKVRQALRKIDSLAAKAEKLKENQDKANELIDQINGYKAQIPNINVNGVEYSYDQLEEALGAENVSSAFEDVFSAQDEVQAKTGLDQLMDRYKEMLDQECDWVTIFDKSVFEKEFHIKFVAVKLNVNFVVKGNVNIAIGADIEYQVGKRYCFWLHLMDSTSGSSEVDLIDERFGFQFYVMGTLGLKIGIRAEVAVGIISTSIASVGANIEFGPYLRLWGYFVYVYEKLRPANTAQWNESQEMLGAMYLEFGLYVIVKFKAQVFNDTFTYEPTLYDKEFPLLTAGEKKNVYDFAMNQGEDDVLYIDDSDYDGRNGITMTLPECYRTMKTMDLCSGEKSQEIYPVNKFLISFSDSRFSADQNGTISVDVPDNTRFLKCNMRIVWKCDKLAFSKYDTDITVPVMWTDMSQTERNQKFTASVAIDDGKNGFKTVWSQRYTKMDTFDLPSEEEILKLINYDSYNYKNRNLKYDSIGGYKDKSTGLNIICDTTFFFNVKKRTYTLTVNGVHQSDGTTSDITYTTTYGSGFDLHNHLNGTGKNNPDTKEYTSFNNLTDKSGGDFDTSNYRRSEIC